jgi:hypothetical protein
VARAIGGLVEQIGRMGARVTELEAKLLEEKLQEPVVPVAVPSSDGAADDDRVTKLHVRTRA